MTAVSLQDAMILALRGNDRVSSLVDGRIYDNAPKGVKEPYITLGPFQEIDDSAECIDGAEAYQQIDVWTKEAGSQRGCKEVCRAVKKALHDQDMSIGEGAVVLIEVTDWRVTPDPEKFIAHGIVNVRVLTED